MTTRHSIRVRESLTIVRIEGCGAMDSGDMIDPPGTANFLVAQIGFMTGDGPILWTNYGEGNFHEDVFEILIDSKNLDSVCELVHGYGYKVRRETTVKSPIVFGDESGTVAICKHPDGWVILN